MNKITSTENLQNKIFTLCAIQLIIAKKTIASTAI